MGQMVHITGAYSTFVKHEAINFYYPLGGTLVHQKLFMSIKFHATHLHTWVHKRTVQ